MSAIAKECPDCHVLLNQVSHSELLKYNAQYKLGVTSAIDNSILKYFDFFICRQCGWTMIFAGSKLKNLVASTSMHDEDYLPGVS